DHYRYDWLVIARGGVIHGEWLRGASDCYNVFHSSNLASDGDQVLQLTVIADMDASDTAHIVIRQSAGTQQTDIFGAATMQTFFSGYLVA
ncbi:hypothetical protein LCGC14_2005200, partial [marine sediment metagenome]